jgi:hypothetical protein
MKTQPVKLLDSVRHKIWLKHHSIRTEKAYIYWIKRYIYFHNKQLPENMGCTEIEAFLTDLAFNRKISTSTQNRAFNALLFLINKFKFDGVNAIRATNSTLAGFR